MIRALSLPSYLFIATLLVSIPSVRAVAEGKALTPTEGVKLETYDSRQPGVRSPTDVPDLTQRAPRLRG